MGLVCEKRFGHPVSCMSVSPGLHSRHLLSWRPPVDLMDEKGYNPCFVELDPGTLSSFQN